MATAPPPFIYDHVLHTLAAGQLTPFLGAGVNLGTSLSAQPFVPGQRLPSGAELARNLAQTFSYPFPDDDLVRVSQWVSVELGTNSIYQYLHGIFDRDYALATMHRVLAQMPRYVREQRDQREDLEYPLFITTNYDDALERAFQEAGEKYDLLTYWAQLDDDRGKLLHTPADGGDPMFVQRPDHYEEVDLTERPVILKFHGAVTRHVRSASKDSYVLTEDDYIDYLTRTDIDKFVPASIVGRMNECHYLFLGYSLRDWNLRAILHRISRERPLDNKSWAMSPNPDSLEEKAWNKRNVDMYDIDITEFAKALDQRMTSVKETVEG
jgi:hypothetical protein